MKVDCLECTGCGACENVCPTGAILMKKNEEGFLYPFCQTEKCIGCGACEKVCHNLFLPDGKQNRVCLAAQACDDIRLESSSGGIFTLIAEQILHEKGYVCGAAYEDYTKVLHVIVSEKQELAKLRTSKYVQSEIGLIYREVKRLLADRQTKVLFSGTPCQIAGLLGFLRYEPDNLYTIDILCHGVPPQSLFDRYLWEEYPDESIEKINFRDKSNGWTYNLQLKVSAGQSTYCTGINEDAYFKAFNARLSLRSSCGVCKFASADRMGDISLGDFWEIWTHDRSLDDRKGTSLVLLNSEKGERLFREIMPKLKLWKEVPISVAKQGNITLSHPIALHENRGNFFQDLNTYSVREAVERNTEGRT